MNQPRIDINQVRADTPGCENILHFDNAGASLPPNPVFDTVLKHLQLERELGGYRAAAEATDRLESFYTGFSRLLNCDPGEIAYVENATRGWDMAFYAIPFNAGDRILTSRAEYASNYLAFLQHARRRQLIIDVIPDDSSGQLDIEQLEQMIRQRTRLIAITHVPTQGGLVNPVAAVGRIARQHGVNYLLDACQSVGQMPLDVEAIGCDMLSGTGRKYLRGPRGTGFLYVRDSVLESLEPPFIDLHSATWTDENDFRYQPGARRFENWESYVSGKLGLAAAVDYALALGLDVIEGRIRELADRLRNSLQEIDEITLHDQGPDQCGIVSFTRRGETPQDIHQRLTAAGVNTTVSSASYARLDLAARQLDAVVRASLHYFNTELEIDRFCELLR